MGCHHAWIVLLLLFVTETSCTCETDFLVIGSGPAGCVSARRMAEAGFKVHLLERGNSVLSQTEGTVLPPWDKRLPINYFPNNDPTKMQLVVLPESSSYAWVADSLGGGSAVNAMIYLRPEMGFFDNDGHYPENWNSEAMLEDFKKVENASAIINADPSVRGQSGPLQLETNSYVTPLMGAILTAAEELGFDFPADMNAVEDKSGISLTELPRRNGLRLDAFTAYILSAPKDILDNITVSTGVTVSRVDILIDEFGNRKARGVFGIEGGPLSEESYFCANQGVILAAGALNSPVILERSGVGDPEVLNDLGIDVVLENAQVGQNLQDHVQTPILVHFKYDRMDYPYSNRVTKAQEYFRFLRHRDGLFADSPQSFHFFSKENNSTVPNFQVLFQEVATGFIDRLRDTIVLAVSCQCVDVQSRGEVHYSGNPMFPLGNPLLGIPSTVNPNYASTEQELSCLAKGQRRLRELIIKSGLAVGEIVPGEGFVSYDDGAFEFNVERLRSLLPNYATLSGYHFSGGSSLGMVVDGETMEVFGYDQVMNGTVVRRIVEGLYMVDGSVNPQIPRVNTMALAYASAEYASSLILEKINQIK